MIHLIWHGKGYLVAVFVFAFSLIANLATNSIAGNDAYWNDDKWPLAVSLFVSAAACWSIGRRIVNQPPRLLIDPATGEQVILRNSHTFFFIPIVWWGPILAAFGVIALGYEFLRA